MTYERILSMWCELIQRICPGCTFYLPATRDQISRLEKTFQVRLPDNVDLASLLYETNGVGKGGEINTVWPIETIEKMNSDFRSVPILGETFASFDQLLFFAGAGNGDYFAFDVTNGEITRQDIIVWDHEDDRRRVVAN